ncbi:MAG: TIGR03564 family F420-dependent LLM class oxidoreductase [Acidimicrobiia bacterium]
MRIGLSGGGATIDRIVEQAVEAEADGFTTLWYAGAASADPLLPIAFAGRATTTIELGTSVVQTYPVHPVQLAQRAFAVADAIGRPAFTLGVGPSHAPVIEGMYGLDYTHAGRHTEEYVTVLAQILHGEAVDFEGVDFRVHRGALPAPPAVPVELLVSALAPRLLRVAGAVADGTILWMANATAVATHVVPRLRAAAEDAGRPSPRIVVGLPVAAHDDVEEARRVAAEQFAVYGNLPNYQRILAHGGLDSPADAAIVGDEAAVTAQIKATFEAGGTDFWAAPFPVGTDRSASRARTRALLAQLAAA